MVGRYFLEKVGENFSGKVGVDGRFRRFWQEGNGDGAVLAKGLAMKCAGGVIQCV